MNNQNVVIIVKSVVGNKKVDLTMIILQIKLRLENTTLIYLKIARKHAKKIQKNVIHKLIDTINRVYNNTNLILQ